MIEQAGAPGSAPAEPQLAADWWARGLTLKERRVWVGSAGSPAPADESAGQRLDRWRAGHGADVAARVAEPSWVGYVERAVAAAPCTGERPSSGSWSEAFALAVRPFAAEAGARLRRCARSVAGADPAVVADPAMLADQFESVLGSRLARLAARTLVLELNLRRVRGELRGADSRERFADFVSRVGARRGLVALCEKYPVLARLLAEASEFAVDAYLEMLGRFAEDHASIVDTLLGGAVPGPLVSVETGLGDRHGRGRAVAVLAFADGRRLVYKPRSVAVYARFAELVDLLNRDVAGLDLYAVRTVPGAGHRYGWLEFIPTEPCATPAEVHRFYRRQGALLALLHCVRAADVHCANLIAWRDQPVLVDLETVFHPTVSAGSVAPDPAARALDESVYRTALLPQLIVGTHGSLDISGLAGGTGEVYPDDGVDWDLPGTDEMRLARRPVATPEALNRVRLGAAEVDPGDYEAALLEGFRSGYDAIARQRDAFVRILGRCADDEIRVVARPTHLYQTLLDESTHPDVLRDGLDRDRVLDTLWPLSDGDPVRRRLVPHETVDIWAGDVPLFVSRPASRDVVTSTGVRLPGLLSAAGLDRAVDKVSTMDDLDRREQEWIVSASLAIRAGGGAHHLAQPAPEPQTAVAADPGRLLAAACGIADLIVARGVGGAERVNWLGVELVDERQWMLLPMGAGLATGYSGVALFLAQLADLTGVARYADVARRAIRAVPLVCDAAGGHPELIQAVGCGGFAGFGGISYALARIGRLLDDEPARRWAARAVELASAAAVPTAPAGVVAGTAGCLAAASAVHAELGLDLAGELAGSCAERLVELAAGFPDGPAGFADGPAGVAWALARYAATAGHDRYRDAAVRALAAASARAASGPPPPAASGRPAPAAAGWCTGTAGFALARAQVADRTAGSATDVPRDQPDPAVTALIGGPVSGDLSLCHGELGVCEALIALATPDCGRIAGERRRRAALVLGALERYGPRGGAPRGVPTPGLLNGLAGIGYGLLRLGYPGRVPSVLLLEPTPGTTTLSVR